jgi:transcriptional regulator of nitric oxide reductase
MSKDIILLAAIGAAVFLVMKKQATAATAQAVAAGGALTNAQKAAMGLIYTPQQTQVANVNGDMWARLLGDGWRNLVGASNKDGTQAFVTNSYGQVTTSDGKPIGSGDPVADFANVIGGVPVTAPTPYTDSLFPLTDSFNGAILNWDF